MKHLCAASLVASALIATVVLASAEQRSATQNGAVTHSSHADTVPLALAKRLSDTGWG